MAEKSQYGRNQTKPLLGIETISANAGGFSGFGRNQTKPLLGIETFLSGCK